MYFDIGSYGSNNDKCCIQKLKNGMTVFKKKEHLPEADSLERSWVSEKVLYYLVGDKAFSLQLWLLRT